MNNKNYIELAYKTIKGYNYRVVFGDADIDKIANLETYGIIKIKSVEFEDHYFWVVSRETFKLIFHLLDNSIDF